MGTTAPSALVLLIDDSQAMLDLMHDLLVEAGYQVSVSLETLDLDRLKALRPDVIVQELVFAGTQEIGWEFLTLSQLDPELSRVLLILCTAAVDLVQDPGMAQNLDHLGIRVVLKPFNEATLLTAIAETLTAQTLITQALDV